ncbi:MAG: long-chain fatty acid--CoA ligase [Pseudomonadota bacterium]
MALWSEDIISVDEARTLDGLFTVRVHRSPDAEAFSFFDRNRESWITYTWREMEQHIARWQTSLRNEGLASGDRVGVLLRNCPQWVMFEQAALSLGLVVVPLYTDDRPDNIAYIIDDADIRLILVQDARRWKRLAPIIVENSPDEQGPLQRVLLLDEGDEAARCERHDDIVKRVSSWLTSEHQRYQPRRGDGLQLATIVYTSGTTGRPKGVMLNHLNILSNAHAGLTMLDCYRQDHFLSFLPLSHMFERTAGYYVPVMAGARVSYARSVAQLAEDFKGRQPTLIVAVPRVFEKVLGKLNERLNNGPRVKRLLFDKAVNTGWSHFLRRQGRGRWKPSLLLHGTLDHLVGKPVREGFGGNLRSVLIGGAALSAEVSKVFSGLGINVIQGYGLTETSPILSANSDRDNKPDSVGQPLRGIAVKIGENSELLAKSPGVMLGYWNNHAATKQVIDAEGWFHTGDQARISDSGHIYITGRIKDILVLSNGEKIPPADMEGAISMDDMIDQVLVVGEGRSYLTALVVVDETCWNATAAGKPYTVEFLNSEEVAKDVLSRIRKQLKDFPGYAKIRKATLLTEPWTLENGLLTPTLKVKKPKVLERYAAEIDRMYAEGPG